MQASEIRLFGVTISQTPNGPRVLPPRRQSSDEQYDSDCISRLTQLEPNTPSNAAPKTKLLGDGTTAPGRQFPSTMMEYRRLKAAQRACKLGVGDTATDYRRHIDAKKARELGVGNTPADYQRYLKSKKAQELGVGNTAVDYQRFIRSKKARELGVGNTPADYGRYLDTQKAQKLDVVSAETEATRNVDDAGNDILSPQQRRLAAFNEQHKLLCAQRAQKLGVGTTRADYQRHMDAKRAQKLGVGETARDYKRYIERIKREKANKIIANCGGTTTGKDTVAASTRETS